MRPQHKKAHPECVFGATTWGACDKATKAVYEDWQAFQQCLLGYMIVIDGRAKDFKKEKSLFAQLVLIISGDADEFTTEDGVPNRTPWVARLRAAMDRFKAGDFPAYNLYQIPTPPGEG